MIQAAPRMCILSFSFSFSFSLPHPTPIFWHSPSTCWKTWKTGLSRTQSFLLITKPDCYMTFVWKHICQRGIKRGGDRGTWNTGTINRRGEWGSPFQLAYPIEHNIANIPSENGWFSISFDHQNPAALKYHLDNDDDVWWMFIRVVWPLTEDCFEGVSRRPGRVDRYSCERQQTSAGVRFLLLNCVLFCTPSCIRRTCVLVIDSRCAWE